MIDHLQVGTLRAVSDALDLENRGYSCTTATIAEKPNPFIKTNLCDLPERDLKRIALLSPEPTINAVQGGRIAEKFVYLLCANANCITRTINEDVPPRFYSDAGHDPLPLLPPAVRGIAPQGDTRRARLVHRLPSCCYRARGLPGMKG